MTEERVIQTVDNHRGLWREGQTVRLDLGKDRGHRGGVQNPAPFRDCVDADVGRRVGQPVRVAAADEESRSPAAPLGQGTGQNQLAGQVRLGVKAQLILLTKFRKEGVDNGRLRDFREGGNRTRKINASRPLKAVCGEFRGISR